jgi:hypothetical protein
MKSNAPFEFFETAERDLIAEYISVRRRVFRLHYPWLPEEFGREDETDRVGHIVLARRDGIVSGGARLTVSLPGHPRKLPLEEAGFDLHGSELLQDLNLARTPYAEIGRMAVDPSCAHGLEVSCGLARELCRVAAGLGVDAILSICPESAVRLNRRNAGICGVAFRRVVELPTVFGVDMWLCLFNGIREANGHRETRESLRCEA